MENKLNSELESIFGIVEYIHRILVGMGIPEQVAAWLDQVISVFLLILIIFLLDLLIRFFLQKILQKLVRFTRTQWDDLLMEKNVFRNLVHIVPAMIFILAAPIALKSPESISIAKKVGEIYIIIQIVRTINAAANAFTLIFSRRKNTEAKPIKVIFQVLTVIAYFFGTILIIGIIFNLKFTSMIAGLGASMAILLLIFKDSILGFVAGIQLTTNDMLHQGDWITIPKHGVDGTVEDVSLYAVKVRNFDNTVTNIPPYSLVSEPFQNWRGMEESDGRRAKRSINIDITSVKFCTPEMLERFSKIMFIKDYITTKENELKKYNDRSDVDYSIKVNGRRQTNIGIFRAYLQRYLENSEAVNSNLTCMVRQLQPTEKGVPLELYFFTKTKSWVEYENVQSDIFDHVLAIIPEFDLKLFQNPSSSSTSQKLVPDDTTSGPK